MTGIMRTIELPRTDGTYQSIELADPPNLRLDRSVAPVRLAYAAAHVVRKAGTSGRPISNQIDWEATAAFRRYIASLGLGVAEAMDTAQRGLLGWEAASELLERTLADARDAPPAGPWPGVIGGAGTDGLKAAEPSLTQIVDEYVRQGEFIQSRGGLVILLATPLLPARGASPEDYLEVYTQVARQLRSPLFVHWLGPMFARELEGYFPADSFEKIMDANAGRIKGVKLSLLDKEFEIETRRRLARNGQIVLTGDDYHYDELIEGDGSAGGEGAIEIGGLQFGAGDFSHALLGIFDAIAPVAAKALEYLARGERKQYRALLEPTLPLARHLFAAPTEHYKAGVVFLAYLNGHQDEFTMLGDLEQARPAEHYVEVFRLANGCGALGDPEQAAQRLKRILPRGATT